MKRMAALAGALLALAGFTAARAATVEDLKAEGYFVVIETRVAGDFNGCDRDVKVYLQKGGVFVCRGFGYMYAHNPRAVLLRSKDGRAFKLLVNGTAFDGQMG